MLLEVGRIEKPHGLRGDVIVKLTTNVVSRVAPGSVLLAGARELRVARSTPHQHRFIVTFDGVNSREEAEALHGVGLQGEFLDDDDPETLWVHELIGRAVIDQHGTELGRVVAVLDNPASDLLELERGGLIPLNFVTDSSDKDLLLVDIPEGLLDPDLTDRARPQD